MEVYSVLSETDSRACHSTSVSGYTEDKKSHIPRGSRRGPRPRGGEWRQDPARGGRRALSLPTSPSHLPLYNRYEALEYESQNNDEDVSPSQLERARYADRTQPTGKSVAALGLE